MRRVTIAVIGNGKTTRANLEALITDMVEALDSAAIAIVYKEKPSDGQVWAEQLAAAKGIPHVAYENNGFATLLKEHKDNEIKFFMLWDDEDPDCQLASSVAQENNILAYDLTDGLMRISLSDAPIAEPKKADIPEIETKVSDEPLIPPAPVKSARVSTAEELVGAIADALDLDEALEDEDEEEDENWDLGELVETAFGELAKHMANVFVEEVKRLLK